MQRKGHTFFKLNSSSPFCDSCRKEKKPGGCICPPPPSEKKLPPQDDLTPRTSRQKFLHYFGKVLAAILAIASGVTTAAAFVALNMVSAGAPTIIIAILIFLAGFAANWYIFRTSTPRMLVQAFGKGWPFQTLMSGMSLGRKVAMCGAILLSLCAGFTTAALTNSSALSLTVALGISSAFPPLAILLFVVNFVCLSSTLLYNFRPLILNPNPKKDVKEFLEKLFSTDPKFKHNCIEIEDPTKGIITKPKPLWRRRLEVVFKVLVALTIVSLAGFGLFMTMSASAAGFKTSILRIVPDASIQAVEIAGKVICMFGALLGRIPFTTRNVFKSLAKVFTSEGTPLSLKFSSKDTTNDSTPDVDERQIEDAQKDVKPIMIVGKETISIYGRKPDADWAVTTLKLSELTKEEQAYVTNVLVKKDTTFKSPDFYQTPLQTILYRAHTPDNRLLPPSNRDQFVYCVKAGSGYTASLVNAFGNGFIAGMLGGGAAPIVGGSVLSASAGVASMSFDRPPPKKISPPSLPGAGASQENSTEPKTRLAGNESSFFAAARRRLGLSTRVSRDDATLPLLGEPSAQAPRPWIRRRSSVAIRAPL